MEVDRRDGGDRVDAQALRVARQFHGVARVVAGDMADDDHFAANGLHDVFKDGFALADAQVNALA